ncbi:unnamed protein product [Orchesella dallaii]|uniref:NAD(P)(+)--arginine ADP-ribosyltransferase n=1 Tax=Orchesella dallaii TaxID=48710 RepID=A0ABP1PJX1_9HEXA
MSTYIRFVISSILVLVLGGGVLAKTTDDEYPLQSLREELMGINYSHPKTGHNETLNVKKEDQIYNLTRNETYNLNVTNQNETLPELESEVLNLTSNETMTYNLNVTEINETFTGLEFDKVLNLTYNETMAHNLNVTNLNETSPGLETEKAFSFTEKENHNDTDTHHHKHFNDTNYNETAQPEGTNYSHPETDHSEILISVKKEDQIHNLTENETFNLNVTNLNETLPELESGKVFNFTRRDETGNLIVTNLNETLSGLESKNIFNFTEKENHNDTDTDTHHHKHFNDTNYNETVQSEEVFNFSGNETDNDTDHQSHLNSTNFGETLLDLLFKYYYIEKAYNFTDIEEFNETNNGTSNFTSFDNLTTTTTPTTTEADEEYYVEPKVVTEHIDFVLLRLKHISMRTSSNITELLELQQKEFEENLSYKYGWENAESYFNSTIRDELYNISSNDSIVRQVPEEYHIAIIAYTGSTYVPFNQATREVCSGNDIDDYQWKSYFKLLQLAVETLGTQEEKWRDNRRFLYRGAKLEFILEEGQVIAFQHFVSTSVALRVAEGFAGESLFEFQGLYNGTAMAVWDHSYYVTEQEYLFSPLQTFRVDSIHVGRHYTRYVLVKNEQQVISNLQTNISHVRGNLRITSNSNSFHAQSWCRCHLNSVLLVPFIFLYVIINKSNPIEYCYKEIE